MIGRSHTLRCVSFRHEARRACRFATWPHFAGNGIFLTMKVLENKPAVLSHGTLCNEKGYFHEWSNGHKPHLI